MDNEKEEWNEVEISDSKEESVEYEVADSTEEVETKPEETPQELEGIETRGAQKRIRQLIKQRKDPDFTISE